MGDKKTHSSVQSRWIGVQNGVENGVTGVTSVPLCAPVAPPLYMKCKYFPTTDMIDK